MKKLYLIRHGKSDHGLRYRKDFDRPLNKRGERDCSHMGRRLLENNIRPDIIISSTAMRARTTAELLAKELDYPIDSIQFDDDLYLCETEYFFDVMSQLSSDPATLFIVAHNPGIHEAEHYLSGVERDNVPTCGICGFEMPSWTYPEMFSCKEIFYDYPKNVLH